MSKYLLRSLVVLGAGLCLPLQAQEKEDNFAIVNFAKCMVESKHGKKEQENFENLRKQVASMMEETEKELKEVSQKLEDPDYLDSISPKAEEDLNIKRESLSEDLNRYRNQFYQVLQQAQMQSVQKINQSVANAAEKVAQEKGLSHIVNKELYFYYNPKLEMTETIIDEMDKAYEIDEKKAAANAKIDANAEVAENLEDDLEDFELEEPASKS